MGVGILMTCRPAPAGTWTDLGPDLGGRLDGIVADPANPNVLVVASPGGGVWRTQQGGGDWKPALNYGLGEYSGFHLEWDRVSPSRLLAVTWSDLYASTDLGEHWTNLTEFGGLPAPLMPFDHGADPKPFAQLKLSSTESVILWSRPCQGLYYSYNGATFIHHWPFSGGSSNPDNCIQSIAADDESGRIYFSTMGVNAGEPAHVYANTCAWTTTTPCLTWTAANTNLPTGVSAAALTWTGAANRLAAALPPSRGAAGTAVFVTTDGSSWSMSAALPSPNWDPRPLLWPGLEQLLLGTVVAYQTTNLGGSWSAMDLPTVHPDTRAIFAQTYEEGRLGYVWTATDGAMSGSYGNITRWDWTPGNAPSSGAVISYKGLRVWQPYYVAATAQSPRQETPRLFVGSQDNAGLCSDDDGATWTTAGAPSGLGCGDYNSLVFAPSNPNRAYARTCGVGVVRTDNAASAAACANVVWTELTPSPGLYPPNLWVRAMTAVHPTDPDRVYFARARDVAISSDGGATLAISAEFPGGGAQPVSLYVDAEGNIYAGTIERGAFVSTDNGASWTPWGLNAPAPRVVMKIAYSPAAGGTFFMATTDGLYRLLPGGTWTVMANPPPGYTASDIEVDPDCPHRLYMALGFVGPIGVHRGGILMSTDNGTTWNSLTSGLTIHVAPIADVQLSPINSRYLYAAVYGQGAWKYDQGSGLSCPPLIDTPTPTVTSTLVPTVTPTNTPTRTVTATATATSSSSPAPSPTSTPSATFTPTRTFSVTPTATLQPTASSTPVASPTATTGATATATATQTSAPPACVGDCNNDGLVTIDEILSGVHIALGKLDLDTCPPFDGGGDGLVTVDEIVAAVDKALNGC